MSEQQNRNRWRRDGWEATVRIGVLTPHADVGPESERQVMAPPGVAIHASRVPFGAMAAGGVMDPAIPLAPVREFAQPPHVDNAAELLAAAPLNAIAYGFTSSAYVIGVEGEAEMIARLQQRTRDIPVVAACKASVEGLRVLAARRIALVDPPLGLTLSSTPWEDVITSRLASRWSTRRRVGCRATRRRSRPLSYTPGSASMYQPRPMRS